MKRENWLSRQNDQKIINITNYIKEIWKQDVGSENPYYSLYNAEHGFAVERALHCLLAEKYESLEEIERLSLTAAAHLYSLGMNSIVRKNSKDYDKFHIAFTKKSIEHIDSVNLAEKVGLEDAEIHLVRLILDGFHNIETLLKDPDKRHLGARVSLLTSYLILADSIHFEPLSQRDANPGLFYQIGEFSDERFHWFKQHLALRHSIEKDNPHEILYEFKDWPTSDKKLKESLKEFLFEKLNEKLHHLKEVFIRHQVTYYSTISVKFLPVPTSNHQNDLNLFDNLFRNLVLLNTASSSDIANYILSTLERQLDNQQSAYRLIKKHRDEVLVPAIQNRPCHLLLQHIEKIVNSIIPKEEQIDSGPAPEEKRDRINQIREKIKSFRTKRKESLQGLQTNAVPFLLDMQSILLFGFSRIIINTLASLPSECKLNTTIFISVCGSKSRYNYKDELVYSDGIEYAKALAANGFKNITVIPDITVGKIIKSRRVSKIFFGANGIDSNNGNLGHTAGHQLIFDLASMYKLPVYVLADKWKFGKLDEHPVLERQNLWLTTNPKVLAELELQGITLMNPREDFVKIEAEYFPYERTHYFVTDIGVFPSNQIPTLLLES